MKFHQPSQFYLFVTNKGKIIKTRSTFTEKAVLNVENQIGIQAFDFYKENSIVVLFMDGSIRELEILGRDLFPIKNLRTSTKYFDVSKIDNNSFALLEKHCLVLYNKITDESTIEEFKEECTCMLVEQSKLSVLVGTKEGLVRRVFIK